MRIDQIKISTNRKNPSGFLEKSCYDFWKRVRDIENREIFKKIRQLPAGRKVIKINPLNKYIIPPEKVKNKLSGKEDLKSIIKSREDIRRYLQKITRHQFIYYFFEECGTGAEIAEILGIPDPEAESFRKEMIQLVKKSNRNQALEVNPGVEPAGFEDEFVAEIIPELGDIHVVFAHPRVRYQLDEDNLAHLNKKFLTKKEKVEFIRLLRQLENINRKFDQIFRIIEAIVKIQNIYLLNGREEDLNVLEERILAKKLDLDPSRVSRIIRCKYIKIQNRIVSLRDLFISRRDLRGAKGKEILRIILERQGQRIRDKIISRRYSDEELRIQILNEYKFEISRRAINNWKKEILKELQGEHNGMD